MNTKGTLVREQLQGDHGKTYALYGESWITSTKTLC